MIEPSQRILLKLLKSSLFGLPPEYPDIVDWDEVINEAKVHTVFGLISPIVPLSDEISEISKSHYVRIMYEQDRLLRLFNSFSIPCVILKGCSSAVYYPRPYLRTMGDIDVLVPRDKFIEATSILESSGYTYTHGKENEKLSMELRHLGYIRNGIEIELHHHFSTPGISIDDILEDAIFRREYRYLNGYQFPVLPDVENGLVLLSHINQHLQENALGLRQIVDWAMFVNSAMNDVSSQKDLIDLLIKVGLFELASHITRMCNIYLGLKEDLNICSNIDDSLVDELMEIVLNDGNFGRKASLLMPKNERRVRGVLFGIRQFGIWKYFSRIGMIKIGFNKKVSSIKLFAFINGLFVVFKEGIKSFICNKGISKSMKDSERRYELYQKLGVRIGEK